jgi:hypothetical protein
LTAVVASALSALAMDPAAMSCNIPTIAMPTIAVTMAASIRVKPRRPRRLGKFLR